MRIGITRLDSALPLPEYASDGAAAFDLVCRLSASVGPGQVTRIPANVIVQVPPGHVLLTVLRSSTPKRTGLITPNGIGVIDPDFHGPDDEIQVQVYNPTDSAITIERGDRIAQALLVPSPRIEWMEQEPARQTSRGGFGSTG